MFVMDLKARIKNPVWWISLVGAIAMIASYFNVDITKYIGQDWKGLIGATFGLLTLLGITADTSTKGFSDQITANTTVQAVNVEQSKEEITTEASTTAINNTASENSQSVTFDNTGMTTPGNLKIVGQDSTSQVEVKDDSINTSVQDNNTQNRSYDAILQENVELKAQLQNNTQA